MRRLTAPALTLPLTLTLTLLPVLIPAPALAHLGHLGDIAGHDHWVAGAAIGAAVAIGVWGAWKGRKPEPVATAPDQTPDTARDDPSDAAPEPADHDGAAA